MKRKKYDDVIGGDLSASGTFWISDLIIRGRRIKMRGITLCLSKVGNCVSVSPSIPYISSAIRLLKKQKDVNDIKWDADKKQWFPVVTP